jgi:hypothetical protein
MGKILFLPHGGLEVASCRYRAWWVAEALGPDAQCMRIGDILDAEIDRPDVVVFQKTTPLSLLERFKAEGVRIAWDVCDPVWWYQGGVTKQIASLVDFAVASNDRLAADFFAHFPRIPTHTIPDRLKMAHYAKQRQHTKADPVRLIWFGHHDNRPVLFGALSAIERLRQSGCPVELTIFDGAPEKPLHINGLPVYHIPWDVDIENEVIASHDIAILPPHPGIHGPVKSNNKTLTAWACGLPVTTGDDYAHLANLAQDVDYRRDMGVIGRANVTADYTIEKSAAEWRELA